MSGRQAILLLLAEIGVSAHISKVFYINLDTSTDRRKKMEKELAVFPGKVERISAISREQVHEYSSYVYQQGISDDIMMKDTDEIKATIGCWISHTTLLERQTKELHANEHALILEDDAVFPKDWVSRLTSTISTAPKDWDLLKVCGWGSQRAEDAVDGTWSLARGPFVFPSYQDPNAKFHYAGSCGYVVSGRSVARVVQHLKNQPVSDFDSALLSDASSGFPIRTYSMKELLIKTEQGQTTIHTSRMLQAASTAAPSYDHEGHDHDDHEGHDHDHDDHAKTTAAPATTSSAMRTAAGLVGILVAIMASVSVDAKSHDRDTI